MTESNKVFDAYSQYYDLLYRDKDYGKESAYINSLLNRYGVSESSILEFGSGTGKHGNLLTEFGHVVHGIEKSEEMVEQAAVGEGFTCEQGDIRSVKLSKTFDAVVSLFHVISYQVSNSDINSVFARAAEHLQTDGLFVFDFWYTPAVISMRPEVKIKRMTDNEIEICRIAEPQNYVNENRVDVGFTIYAENIATGDQHKFSEIHPMRHFSLPEIDLLAQAHGFQRVGAEEFMTGNSPGQETWGVCVILKRC